MLASFTRDFPQVTLEVSIEEGYVDIVAERFDAGIRMGNSIGAEMTAVRVTRDSRRAVVAAPSYLAEWGIPKVPADLLGHRCIQYRLVKSQAIAAWSFAKGRESLDLHVSGPLVLDTPPLMIDAAIEGAGLAMVMEDIAGPALASGRLVRVLEDWCPRLPGFYLYYRSRRHRSAAMDAFVGRIRFRRPGRSVDRA
jgi:DNA-binding transcriptional LysR family regulator